MDSRTGRPPGEREPRIWEVARLPGVWEQRAHKEGDLGAGGGAESPAEEEQGLPPGWGLMPGERTRDRRRKKAPPHPRPRASPWNASSIG